MDFVVRARAGHFEPSADVFLDEELGRLVVHVDLAGVDPASVRVAADERTLVISGTRRNETRLRRGSFLLKEIAYGDFRKEIHLPVGVDYEAASARYADGLLTIAIAISPTGYIPTTRTDIRMIVKRTLA